MGGKDEEKDRSSCFPSLEESKERRRALSLRYIWKKCREKAVEEEELFTRQIGKEGFRSRSSIC